MDKKRFSIAERIKSFGFALQGIRTFFATQHNAWLHLLAAIIALMLGFYFRLSASEWCWIIISITLVFITEMFNTAIEFLSDIVSPNLHPQIKRVKDVAAAAVLFSSIAAAAIGALVFIPKFF
jgi:diacylglycerol kinase (ATP)